MSHNGTTRTAYAKRVAGLSADSGGFRRTPSPRRARARSMMEQCVQDWNSNVRMQSATDTAPPPRHALAQPESPSTAARKTRGRVFRRVRCGRGTSPCARFGTKPATLSSREGRSMCHGSTLSQRAHLLLVATVILWTFPARAPALADEGERAPEIVGEAWINSTSLRLAKPGLVRRRNPPANARGPHGGGRPAACGVLRRAPRGLSRYPHPREPPARRAPASGGSRPCPGGPGVTSVFGKCYPCPWYTCYRCPRLHRP
jgi:hypothetical protein